MLRFSFSSGDRISGVSSCVLLYSVVTVVVMTAVIVVVAVAVEMAII